MLILKNNCSHFPGLIHPKANYSNLYNYTKKIVPHWKIWQPARVEQQSLSVWQAIKTLNNVIHKNDILFNHSNLVMKF